MQRMRRLLHIAVIFSMLMTLVAVAFPATVGAANLFITPTALNFPQQEVGTTSAPLTVTVNNADLVANVTITDVTGGGANFAVTANGCLNATLAPSEQCTFSVVFQPQSAGAVNATITIGTGGPPPPNSSVSVSGTGVNPVLQYTPAFGTMDFGNVQIGQISAQQVLTIKNVGNSAVQFSTPIFTPSPDFNIEGLSPFSCFVTNPLAPGTSCQARITFVPISGPPGPRNGGIGIVYTNQGGDLVASSYAVRGTAVQASVSAAPNPLNAPDQLVNTPGAPQKITFTNTGVGPVTLTGVTLVGTNPTEFQLLTLGLNNCFSGANNVIAAGASCDVYVRFAPTSTGPKTAQVQFAIDNTPAGVYPAGNYFVQVNGTGTSPVGTVSPQAINFGSQRVGQVSGPVQVTIKNTSNGGYTIPVLAPSTGEFQIQADTCSNTFLQANGTCTFSVVFAPGSTGIKNATINVPGPNPVAIQLTGIGTIGNISAAPNPVNFPNQEVNTVSAAQTVTITNNGPGPATITTVAEASTEFGTTSNTCNGVTLATVGATCTIQVFFTPTTSGLKNALLTVTYDAGVAGATYDVSLIGTATTTPLSITPAGPYNFGNVVIGQTALAIFVVKNEGAANTAPLPAPTVVTTPPFSIVSTSCTAVVLAPGGTCTIVVQFAPTIVGPASGLLSINPQVILLGNGVSPNGALLVDKPQLTFGPQQIGSQSQTQAVIVSNNGNVPVTINTVTAAPADYVPTGGAGTNCVPTLVLDPNTSCIIWLAFQPGGPPGNINGTLTINYTSAAVVGANLIVLLRGTATTPNGTVSPLQLNFGVQEILTTSGPQTVTFTNTGFSTLVVPPVTIGGADLGEYLIQSDSCSNAAVLPQGQCTISVVFKPTTAGAKNADLRVGPLANPVVVTLKGIGFDPLLVVSPAGPVDFGAVIVGSGQKSLKAFTVTNNGSNPKAVPAPVFTGDFAQEANDCPALLGPGQSCTIIVSFIPTAVGPRTGTVTINPIVILNGVGVSPNGALSVSVPQLSFGPQQIGTQSGTQQVIVSNNGNIPVTLGNPAVAVVGADYVLANGAGNTCQNGVILGPGQSCAFSVAFQPNGPPGPKNEQVNVTYTSAGVVGTATVSVLLRGNAITPNGTLTPSQLDFGTQEVNTTSAPKTVTFTNTGTEIIVIPTVSVGGVDLSQYLIQTDNCSGASVLPGNTCTLSVVFKPTTAGAKNADLRVGPLPNPVVATLKGIGVIPTLTVTPSDYNFGNVVINQTAIKAFTVTNTGSNPVTVPGTLFAGDPSFSQLSEDCSILNPLGPGASCTIVVQFAPTTIGPKNGTMTVNPVVTLHGTGIAPGGTLSASPVQLSFGPVQINSMSAAQTITFSNNGTIPVSLTNLPALAGPNTTDFLLTIAGNTCQIGVAIQPGESCVVSVAFRPLGPGDREAWVNLTYSSATVPNGVVSVLLRGVGITPVINVSPAQLVFGGQALNTASGAKMVTITNPGNGPVTIGAIGKGGANFLDFLVISDLCSGSTLAAGATCSFQVIFLPLGPVGARTATVNIPIVGFVNPVLVSLSGQALAAQQGGASLTPSFINFGFVQVLSPSAPQTVTFKNTGNTVVTVNGVVLTDAGGDFSPILANACTGKNLNPGEECTVQVRFRPLTQGSKQAELEFQTTAPGSPHIVSLYGVGITPLLSINPGQLNFGNLQVGTPSAPYTVTLINNSQVSGVTVDSVVLVGGDFALTNDGCTGQTRGPGGFCTFQVVFQPLATGVRNGTATINLLAGNGGPFIIDLVGVGLTPNGMVSPLQLDFGNVPVGNTSNVQTVTFTNTGSGPIGPLPVLNIAGPNPGDFLIQTDSCSNAVVPSGGTCQFSVVARPQLQGPRNAQVSVGPLSNPTIVTLKVNGQVAAPAFQAVSIDFGNQVINTTSLTRTITVTNNGPVPLIIFGAQTIGGANAGDFSIVTSTCQDATLAPGASCQVTLTFKPTALGIRTAYVDFTTNMPVPSQKVALTGNGVPPAQYNVSLTVSNAVGANCTAAGPAGPFQPTDNPGFTVAYNAATSVFIGWELDGYYVGFASPLTFKIGANSHTMNAICVAKPTFSDIGASPYKTQIEQSAAFGFLKGYQGLSGPYGPNDSFLRSQAAVVMIRMANRTNAWGSEVHNNPFGDQCSGANNGCVDPESWNAVATGYEKNVIRGLGFGIFAPFSSVTEMETVAFVTRTMAAMTLELEQHGRLPACPVAAQGTPAPAPLGPSPNGACPVPPNLLTGQTAAKATKWESQPNDGTIYGSVPDGSGFRKDISTYFYYAGVVPGTANQFNAWSTWSSPAKRQQIAAIAWQAYASYWGVDRVNELP